MQLPAILFASWPLTWQEKDNRQDLVKSFERFHRQRGDLEIPRKLYASYFNTNGHGACFYAFGYFYASEVIEYLPNDRQVAAARDIQDDFLSVVELDGTWIDSHAQGKTYTTGMILRTLDNTWSAPGKHGGHDKPKQ